MARLTRHPVMVHEGDEEIAENLGASAAVRDPSIHSRQVRVRFRSIPDVIVLGSPEIVRPAVAFESPALEGIVGGTK